MRVSDVDLANKPRFHEPPARWQPTPGNPFRLADMVPRGDRLLVAPLPVPSRSRGGIHLAETGHQRERPQHGIVLVVGPGAWNAAKEARVPLQLQPGDCVFYGKYSGQEFELDNQRVLNMSEAEVFSVLPVGTFVLVQHDDPKLNHLQGDYCDVCDASAPGLGSAEAQQNQSPAPSALELERERLRAARAVTP